MRARRRTGPVVPRRATRRGRSVAQALPWLMLVVPAALLGACSSVASLGEGRAGLPTLQVAQASLVVAQTRAQFPELSGADIPFQTVKASQEAAERQPEPALRGTGTGVEPGLQRGAGERIEVALYLEKSAYARGYLEVTRAAAPPERWQIVAYDLRGAPREEFQNTYALVDPQERLHYLVLVGGRYGAEGEQFLGYEGTLIEPGPAGDLEHWKHGYKLDFGYRFPLVPAHQRKVEQAVTLFGEIGRDVDQLDKLRNRSAAAEGELATLRNSVPTPEQAAKREAALTEISARLQTLQVERQGLVTTTQAKLLRYYELRRLISDEYAAFTESNRYRWLNRAGKQDVYDKWKVVEFHHPRIDALVTTFLTHTGDGSKLLEVRKTAMDSIARNDNWSKDPSRPTAGGPAPAVATPAPAGSAAPAASITAPAAATQEAASRK